MIPVFSVWDIQIKAAKDNTISFFKNKWGMKHKIVYIKILFFVGISTPSFQWRAVNKFSQFYWTYLLQLFGVGWSEDAQEILDF